MKFSNFYKDVQQRLQDSILSLWATGNANMQEAFIKLFEHERLLSEPIFQTSFPWEESERQFGELSDIYDSYFIRQLDRVAHKDYRFPNDRYPYKHQVEAWQQLINNKKSIAVTTGTGSGKTECFMLPVLYDLHKNYQNELGVRAIFLYPLNALIGSQKKRVDAWVRNLGGLSYAVYNGNTEEQVAAYKQKEAFPEIISRENIRNEPPQILFTNPTMLEYMLVRDKDVPLLERSQGKLRWILLDEAHTLTGSAAAEMALLIRRVVDAFNVDISDLRFAITSATVGQGVEAEQSLKKFMSDLCGIEESQIKVITGRRQSAQIDSNPLVQYDFETVKQLRDDILREDSLSLSNISKRFSETDTYKGLNIIDQLAESTQGDTSVFPVRGHFFGRGIGGVYVCTNKYCTDEHKVKSLFGRLTSFAAHRCQCGHPLVELVSCRSCGNELLMGQLVQPSNSAESHLQLVTSIVEDNFVIHDTEDDEEHSRKNSDHRFFFTKQPQDSNLENLSSFNIGDQGSVDFTSSGYVFYQEDGVCKCPHCHSKLDNELHFRLSSSFVNRVLSDIFLEYTPEAEKVTTDMNWKGRKYISFTDSRQGTAKVSALLNIDNESFWLRSQMYHKLLELQPESSEELNQEERDYYQTQIEEKKKGLRILPPSKHAQIEKEIEELKQSLNGQHFEKAQLSWPDFTNFIKGQAGFESLFSNNSINNAPFNRDLYIKGLLYDEFARRLPRERSLENLGVVSIYYPKIEDIGLPHAAKKLNISESEYHDLLKIALDYSIRYPFHIAFAPELYPYSTSFLRSVPLFPSNAEEKDAKKWPVFDKKSNVQSRLILLICAGLGIHQKEDFDETKEDDLNALLSAIWSGLVSNRLLTNQGNNSYKLNLEEASVFRLSDEVWLCPVKKRLIDCQFKGYSPWITGRLSPENIEHYRIVEPAVSFPVYPYAFNRVDNVIDDTIAKRWIDENSTEWRAKGIWNDIHERVLLHRPIFLSGEHSAQQSDMRLKELESRFEEGNINILNCSTTMEMGVDIGGVSLVVMNNVPPGPANYLQRAGRAGRRREAKSLAYTICGPTPVGLNVLQQPDWALKHKIAAPYVAFNSESLVLRHVNSYLLGCFIQTEFVKGVRVTDKVIDMFFSEHDEPFADRFGHWLSGSDSKSHHQNLQNLVRSTPLRDKLSQELLMNVKQNFEHLLEQTIERNKGYDQKIENLVKEFGEDSPAVKAVTRQRHQFINQNAIGYLVAEGFLPSAGLPTGIVEFDIVNRNDIGTRNRDGYLKKKGPSHFITKALTEFAPGTRIVIDGMTHVSAGLTLANHRSDASRELIQSCTNCGYQRLLKVEYDETPSSSCSHCGEQSFTGIRFVNPEFIKGYSEVIEPVGFAVDIAEEPTRKISEKSEIHYVDPVLINVKPWEVQYGALFDLRQNDVGGEILYYNVGKGNGFSVCLSCGRASTNPDDLINHSRLRGGKDIENSSYCKGNENSYAIRRNVIIGGRFQTDYCELRIKDKTGAYTRDEKLLYTLGAIFTKMLAQYLAIEGSELGFSIKKYKDYATLFIFDTAKGGAGYAPQFNQYTREIFDTALNKLNGCSCFDACTKCLIDRNTQWHVDNLDRTTAIEWLSSVLNMQVPEEVLAIDPNFELLFNTLPNELGTLALRSPVKAISLTANDDYQSWNLEEMVQFQKLASRSKLSFVLRKGYQAPSMNEIVEIFKMENWTSFYEGGMQSLPSLKLMAEVQMQDGIIWHYYTRQEVSTSLNKEWAVSKDGQVFKLKSSHKIDKRKITWTIPSNIEMTDIKIMAHSITGLKSDQVARLVLDELGSRIDLLKLMQDKTFDITYSDRYAKNPFSVILLLQFIESLRSELGFEIGDFDFYGQAFQSDRDPIRLFHSFRDDSSRNSFVNIFSYEMGVKRVSSKTEQVIPHYRYLEFESDDLIITIRPDGGIEHGWKLKNAERYDGEDINILAQLDIYQDTPSPILYYVSVERK